MGAKTDVIVKLVFVFFISLLSFSIGTFVGKKYSDNQYQLAALEPNKNKAIVLKEEHGDGHGEARQVASEGHGETHGDAHGDAAAEAAHGEKVAETAAHGSGHDMTDEEIAKLGEEFLSEESANAATAETAKTLAETAAPAHSSAKKEVVAHMADVKKVAMPMAAAPKAETSRVPTSLPKDVGTFKPGKFTVQVASYGDEKEAQSLAGSLKAKGYTAFYIPAEIKGKTWYRVSVGQFNTMKEAQDYRTEMLAKSDVATAIVQKISND